MAFLGDMLVSWRVFQGWGPLFGQIYTCWFRARATKDPKRGCLGYVVRVFHKPWHKDPVLNNQYDSYGSSIRDAPYITRGSKVTGIVLPTNLSLHGSLQSSREWSFFLWLKWLPYTNLTLKKPNLTVCLEKSGAGVPLTADNKQKETGWFDS